MEEWRKVSNYPKYEISSYGRVRSLYNTHQRLMETPKILSIKTDRVGYKFIHLINERGRKPLRIHRLVAETFLHNPNNFPEVNHKDEDKSNNKTDNLEWCTKYANMHHSKAWEVNQTKILQYDKNNMIRSWDSMSEASRFHHITPQSIFAAIKNGWKAAGYYWKYQ